MRYAIILAGGSVTRLWPWSRSALPKLLALKQTSTRPAMPRLYYAILLLWLPFTALLAGAEKVRLSSQAAEQTNPPVLRGTPMVLGKALGASVAFAMDLKNWQQVKDLGLNTVRVCWVDPWYADRKGAHRTAEEVLPKLDQCVTNAQVTGLNIIINYHNVGEQQEQKKSGQPLDFIRLAGFWRLVAPRYKNQALVFYELSNEPSFDGNMFLKPEFHSGLMRVYRQVRQDAPQRMVLLFSFNSTDPDLKAIVDGAAHTMMSRPKGVAYG